MTSVILDPTDPSVAFIGDATDPDFGIHTGDALIANIHDARLCEGRGCVIHHPSEHHMRDWRLTWRGDKHVFERACPHGVGHPDPDDAAYLESNGYGAWVIHGCDGCCRPDKPEQY